MIARNVSQVHAGRYIEIKRIDKISHFEILKISFFFVTHYEIGISHFDESEWLLDVYKVPIHGQWLF
jgi:hypothetical protein